MKTVKELHELNHPLHEYTCRCELIGGAGYNVYVTRLSAEFPPAWPIERELLATKLKSGDAGKLMREINALIDAATRIAT